MLLPVLAVGDAVKSVADKIKSFLHFSVPDEGPLTEYEEWMPDFMQGLAKGIERSKGLVTDAVKGLASDMVVNPNVTASMNGIAEAPTASTGSSIAGFATAITDAIRDISGQSGDIVIPVYLGGTMLDEVIVSAQQRANLRSGGR
jgi:phage-related protein